MAVEARADGLGHRLGAGVVGVAAQHREGVVGEPRHQQVVALGGLLQPGGHALQQLVGVGQADVAQQRGVVVGLDQQHGLLAAALGRAAHGLLELGQEVGAVEQRGDLVALAQLVELADHLLVDGLLAEHHLQAGLALPGGLGELHHRVEGAAVAALGGQL